MCLLCKLDLKVMSIHFLFTILSVTSFPRFDNYSAPMVCDSIPVSANPGEKPCNINTNFQCLGQLRLVGHSWPRGL